MFGLRNIQELIEQTPYLLRDRVADAKAFGLFGTMLICIEPCAYQYEKVRFLFTAQQKLAVMLHLFVSGPAQNVAFLSECCDQGHGRYATHLVSYQEHAGIAGMYRKRKHAFTQSCDFFRVPVDCTQIG